MLGAPHLDFEMWETTNSMKLLDPARDLVNKPDCQHEEIGVCVLFLLSGRREPTDAS
jgi:hypothetical protein